MFQKLELGHAINLSASKERVFTIINCIFQPFSMQESMSKWNIFVRGSDQVYHLPPRQQVPLHHGRAHYLPIRILQ